jgi:hypothetical protein
MFCARAHIRSKLASKASTTDGLVMKIRSLSWLASPDREKLPDPVTQQLPIDRIRFQMHQNTLALDPRYDVRVGKQRFDEPASNGSVLGELRLVEIEADDHVPFRGGGQRLDDLRVGEDVSRHVDGESSAANLLSVHRLEIFSRSIMDLDLGAALGPSRRRQDRPSDADGKIEAGRHWQSCECERTQPIVVSTWTDKGPRYCQSRALQPMMQSLEG